MGTNSDHDGRVTVDDRGRITLPQDVRGRLGIDAGDDLDLDVRDGEVHLRPNRPTFEPIRSNRDEWGPDAFLDAGEATFGDLDGDDGDR